MPKGVRRIIDPSVDAPPDMAAWLAEGPAAPLPADATDVAAKRTACLLNLARAGQAQGRRVTFDALVLWDIAGPFPDVLSRQKLTGLINNAVRRKWVQRPADRVFYLPACGEHLLMDSPNRSVQSRRAALAEELGCAPIDGPVTERLLKSALIHAGRLEAQADGGEVLAGAAERDAVVQIVRTVLGPMYDRERWILAERGHGLLRLMVKHRAAAVFTGGVLLHTDARLAVQPDDLTADLRWVYVPGLRIGAGEPLPAAWQHALGVWAGAA